MDLMKNKLTVALMIVFSLVIGLHNADCSGERLRKAWATPTEEPTAVPATLTTSPATPTSRPTLDAATGFGTVHSAVLPSDYGKPNWYLQQLIPNSHLFLISRPGGSLPCDGCQFPPGDPANPGKLALWNFKTDAVDVFRTLQPDDSVPVAASDGRYLAWVEGCHNPMGDPWNLYAMDLNHGEIWHVDSDVASAVGDSSLYSCPLGIEIAGGRLVYSTSIANLAGTYVDEVRSYDLANRHGSEPTLSGDLPPINVGCPACNQSGGGLVTRFAPLYSSGNQIVWVGEDKETCALGALQASQAVYVTDVATGDTRFLICKDDSGKDGLLQLLTGSSRGREGTARDDFVQATRRFVFWVPRPEDTAMAYDVKTGDLIQVADHSVDFLAADDSSVYWSSSDNTLHWVDLPQP